MAKRSKSSQGRANVRAVFAGHQSSKRKLLSFHKARRLFQQEPAIRRCRFVTRELDQVAPVQKILEQRFLVRRERRRFRQGGKKFNRRLSRHWQGILISHVAPQNIGNSNTKQV